MKSGTILSRYGWALAALCALAFLLRIPFLSARSLWFDEAFSWRLTALPLAEFFPRAAADVHPVLYYLILRLWMLPFSGSGPETTLFALRFLSVLFGVATTAAMVRAGRILFHSRAAGLLAGLFTAVNSFQLQYAWEARMYTLGTALLPLAMAELVRVAEAPTARAAWRAGLGFGISLGALLHVHYYALFSWVALGAAKLWFFLARMRGGVWAVLRSSTFRAAEVGFWLSAVLFLPWLPVFLAQVRHVQEAYWIPRLAGWSVPNTFARLFWGGVAEIPHGWAVLATAAALLLVVFPLVRGRTFGDLVAAAAFVGPVALAVLLSLLPRSVYLDRYFLFASLGLLLLLARSVSLLPRLVRFTVIRITVKIRAVVLTELMALAGVSLVQFWHQLDFPNHPGARGAAAYLARTVQPSEVVVVSSPFVYFPIAFHLDCRERSVGVETMTARSCTGNLRAHLYSDTGEFAHFAGGPILVREDLVGPEVFEARPVPRDPRAQRGEVGGPLPEGHARLWVVDTTGFGGSRLAVPAPYVLASETRFPELFAYQGDLIVREYARAP